MLDVVSIVTVVRVVTCPHGTRVLVWRVRRQDLPSDFLALTLLPVARLTAGVVGRVVASSRVLGIERESQDEESGSPKCATPPPTDPGVLPPAQASTIGLLVGVTAASPLRQENARDERVDHIDHCVPEGERRLETERGHEVIESGHDRSPRERAVPVVMIVLASRI